MKQNLLLFVYLWIAVQRTIDEVMEKKLRYWLNLALINFGIAACLGTILRLAFITGLAPAFKYQNLLHAHSHIAMLGWIYPALAGFSLSAFIPGAAYHRKFLVFLILFQISVMGMLFSFPFEGYGPVSISFSTLHILLSFAFAYIFYKYLPKLPQNASYHFVKVAFFLQVLSTLGVAFMPLVITQLGKNSEWYFITIQFYIHFQVNGWFVFGGLALLLKKMEAAGTMPAYDKQMKKVLQLLILSVFLTFATVLHWAFATDAIWAVNSLGLIIQAGAFAGLAYIRRKETLNYIKGLPVYCKYLLLTGLAALGIKVLFHLMLVFPLLMDISLTIRHFVIGFLHLVMLGFTSLILLSFIMEHFGKKLQRNASLTFLAGFILTEAMLFGQGLLLYLEVGFLPGFYEILFGAAALLAIAVFMILYGSFTNQIQSLKPQDSL